LASDLAAGFSFGSEALVFSFGPDFVSLIVAPDALR
jgi:hypothetical protein